MSSERSTRATETQTTKWTADNTTAKTAYSRENSSSYTNRKKNPKNKKRVIIGIVIGVVALIAIAALVLFLFIHDVNSKIKLDKDTQIAVDNALVRPETKDQPYYVLLLGSDSRTPGDYSGNSDTIVLARIDPGAPQVTLLSIPRDTEIQTEDGGTAKINSARSTGGEAGAIKAVFDLTGVEIAHFIEIDFTGVIGLVDVLGGITVDVPMEINLDGVTIYPGVQRLNGEQALIMSRCRNFPTGDFIRVQNQRLLLQAVAREILNTNPTEIPGLIAELANYVKTDVSVTEAVDLLLKIKDLDPDGMYMATVPAYMNYHDEVSYVAIQEPEFSAMMERVNQGLPPVDPAAEVPPE